MTTCLHSGIAFDFPSCCISRPFQNSFDGALKVPRRVCSSFPKYGKPNI